MILFGIICMGIMTVLLLLGESTLPLFGGDRELAARVYKTVFMGLSAWTVAGMSVFMMGVLSEFGRAQVAEQGGEAPPLFRTALWIFENAREVAVIFFVLAGIVMSAYMWITEA